uniref:E3 ubiquitin-protein ligase FANCL-like isoform X1 n=1 Tax=Myxine glutinosa TaxID=7769 RepID=UPI003590102B
MDCHKKQLFPEISNDHRLLQECPLLLPQDGSRTCYDGFITIKERDVRIRVEIPLDRQLKNARIYCDWMLQQSVQDYQKLIKQRLQQSDNLTDFLVEFKRILNSSVRTNEELSSPPPPSYYTQLIRDIVDLGWDKISFVDEEFKNINLRLHDACGREHVFALKIKPQYPKEPPECRADLPVPFHLTWPQEGSLESVLTQASDAMDALTAFWDEMDEIDQNTWVLEPERPTRGDTIRRLALGNNASLHMEVDPRHPRMFPECRLLGPEHVVTPLKKKLNAKMYHWDPQLSILRNLQSILGIEFPSAISHSKSDFSLECGICYMYRLDSSLPDQVCDDPRCGQPYHQTCLYESALYHSGSDPCLPVARASIWCLENALIAISLFP